MSILNDGNANNAIVWPLHSAGNIVMGTGMLIDRPDPGPTEPFELDRL